MTPTLYDRDLIFREFLKLKSLPKVAQSLNIPYDAVFRAVHFKQGLCTHCSKPRLENHSYCSLHLKERNRRTRLGKEQLRKSGICTYCCKKPLSQKSTWFCDDCLIVQRPRKAEMTKIHHYKLKSQGLCTCCGKNPLKTAWFCENCLKKHSETSQKRWRKNVNNGLYYSVFERDKGRCQICSYNENICMHHKDQNRNNNVLDNLILLCKSCHFSLTKFLRSQKIDFVINLLRTPKT